MVDDWLKRIKDNVAQGRAVVRRAVTERADHWKQVYNRIANAYLLTELEHNERILEVMALKDEAAKLTWANSELRDMWARAGEKNVVSI